MKNTPARLWIYPAKEARVALIVRRKPHRLWHFLRWNTELDEVSSGDWCRSLFYPQGCDVSWDGRYWIFYEGETSGLAPLGSLDAIVRWDSQGAWGGGGYFESRDTLRHYVPLWHSPLDSLTGWLAKPIKVLPERKDQDLFKDRMRRDGWSENPGVGPWSQRPTAAHPLLERHDAFSAKLGHYSIFSMPDFPKLLGEGVFWATYDSAGDLLAARRGMIERYRLADLSLGRPTFALDLNSLSGERPEPPVK